MSRQLEHAQEERTQKYNNALADALDYGIVGMLQSQGIELLGMSIKHDAFNCLLTVKADIAGDRQVCFIGSDTISNCFIKLVTDGRRSELHWRKDKYAPS